MQPIIIALVDDLMAATRIEGTLGMAGYTVRTVATVDDLLAAARESKARGIVVSFASPALPWRAAIAAVRADDTLRGVPVLAFGPHVDRTSRDAARDAGATRVVTNGLFFTKMPSVVSALIAGDDEQVADEEDE